MKIFSDERLISLGVISGTASRHTGTGRDRENLKKFFKSLNIDHNKILGLNQVHGTEVIPLVTDGDLAAYHNKPEHPADAWLLGKAGCGVLILTADCVPLFVWDDKGTYIGVAHCGWRGVAGGLSAKIAQLVKDKAPIGSKLCAYIGPHINSCCFEVKADVSAKFHNEAVIKRDGKLFVDLTREIIIQLTDKGLRLEDIRHECSCQCTHCNREDFFSYRRDGTKDVLISFAYKI